MGSLIRRDKAIPVQARRVDDGGAAPVGPTVVMVPGAAVPSPSPSQQQPAPLQSSGPQNVIYVVNTPPPAAAVAPPPPQEVHHHHHHHRTRVVLPRQLKKGTSFLGTLGFVIGGLVCLADHVLPTARFVGPVALVGLAMAALAWLGAVLLRRVGAGTPAMGVVLSAVGYGWWLYNTGQAQSTYDRLRTRSPVELPAMKIPGPAGPSAAKPANGH